MSRQTHMYRASVIQWNPFVGCSFRCLYCLLSFQMQLKRWGKNHCDACYRFIPHEHPERLVQPLPRTGFGQFIFTGSSGDITFCTTEYLQKIVDRIRRESSKTFLLQSKNPQTFGRVQFPENVILGVTLETNHDEGYGEISKAPVPSRRYRDFLSVRHALKMVTVEPVQEFDQGLLVEWISNINPCLIWLGYDSRKNRLPEPCLGKVKTLHWELAYRGFTVVLKTIRKAWWEPQTDADHGKATTVRS
jgi:uncharacterized Fe-S cluster-containing radical SAM superfamily protein